MKKKITFLGIVIVLVIAVCILKYSNILAYYTHNDDSINKFSVGNVGATVTEPNYTNNQIIKPNETIVKDPTFSNSGEVNAYIRAQVYVPISKEIKYVDNEENIITPENEIEIFSYTLNDGWVEVVDEASDTLKFSGTYEDSKGNKYMEKQCNKCGTKIKLQYLI